MLTTNMIRKELNSQNQYEAGLALTSLSCYISMDLARDLSNDILTLLSSTKPYIRKKAVLMMYKVFLKYPEALRPAFPKLKEKLEDPDPGVQSAAVNVVCELARKNPKNYLSLAPVFFKLMTTSTNNWMLIKIIKLFGALTPLEPRLGKKLIEPLTNLIHSTSAMSLLIEQDGAQNDVDCFRGGIPAVRLFGTPCGRASSFAGDPASVNFTRANR
jgi:AP-3 complex subunit delta-1